jgi:hypothetical protein
MPIPVSKRTIDAFYWFAAGWLLAVAGSGAVAIVSGCCEWPRVARTAISLGVMPIVTGFGVTSVLKWMHRAQEE